MKQLIAIVIPLDEARGRERKREREEEGILLAGEDRK